MQLGYPKFVSSTFGAIIAVFALMASASAQSAGPISGPTKLTDSARQQITELLAEKSSRTPAQRKIGSSLIYAAKMRRGINLTPNVKMLQPLKPQRADGMVDVQIRGHVSKALLTAIEKSGGKTIYGRIDGSLVRALVPLDAVERLAARSDVRGIHEAFSAMTQQQLAKQRAENLRAPLMAAVRRLQTNAGAAPTSPVDRGSVTSQGVVAHRADLALQTFGATGAGIKIGVLSDSDDFKEQSISTGDLPADTVTVPGQDGRPGGGEGTAMMEIVHDMAPGAQIFFATAFNSPESFADNIRTLRFTYGCDIIVDDVIYFFESPFQDDIIAHAVNDVIADGGMYFASAGNQGNFNDGTSGTWEGAFKKAKNGLDTLPSGYEVQNFGAGVVSDRLETSGGPLILHWSNPGSLDNPQATDDYDLFVLDSDLRNVLVASTDIQDGDDLPFEFLGFFLSPDLQVVIAKKTGSANRTVRIEYFGGELALSTSGSTYGHSTATGAYGVAAVDVAQAGGGSFSAGPTTPIELFSADGLRRVFFDQDGNPYPHPQIRKKPDLAAADGVSTTLPSFSGLNPFFGTSAAAPHAAGIAALLKSVRPTLKASAVRADLTKSALDIEAPGFDRDAGFGIVDAVATLTAAHATPVPFLDLSSVTPAEAAGDGDGFIEPGESASLITELRNIGGLAPANLVGTISTVTPGVTITNASSTFPPIAPFGGTGVNNVPYAFTLSSGLACGVAPEFTLDSTYSNGNLSPQSFKFKVQTGKPGGSPTSNSFSGPPAPIPDSNPAGVNVPIVVSGLSAIATIQFSIDGTTCTTAVGATTVGIDHSWVGDLIMKLTSPSGTTVTLANRPGGTLNSGNNFCQTVFDDSAVNSIQNVAAADAPFTGSFKPASPLAAFLGEDPNGTWVLNVSDNATSDTGTVRAVTLTLGGFVCD